MGGAKSKAQWHPLVQEVLTTLTRDTGGPTVDEQLSFGTWLATLPDDERERATGQLGLIVKRLMDAGEEGFARLVRSIAVFAAQQDAMPHAAARVRHTVER